jgi:two-component system chemotaxis sensor kinase CheA
MDLDKYRKLFLEECREYLQSMNRELLRLEAEGEGFDGIDTLFRDAHSIKGMAGSMGYGPIVALSHAMEDVFDGLRAKTLPVTHEISSLLFEGVDALGSLSDEVEEGGETSSDAQELVDRLRVSSRSAGEEEAAGGEISLDEPGEPDVPAEIDIPQVPETPVPAAPLPPAEETGPGGGHEPLGPEEQDKVRELSRKGKLIYHCAVSISEDTASLTARNFVLLGKMNRVGEIIRSSPSLAEVMEGEGRAALEAYVAAEKTEEELAAVINSVPELTEVTVRRTAVESLLTAPPPVRGGGPARKEASTGPPVADARPDAARSLIDRYLPGKSTSLRVDTRILDDLINIVGELIINRDRLLEVSRDLVSGDLHLALDRLDLLVRHFQDTIMAVRMMPLEIVTDRLPRIVRDLARQGGKHISFEITGQGIELDRAILEEINDVLIHIVRNAIDHGVEAVGEREAAGKPEKATIRLTAGREKDWVWIAVEDDGRGMDVEKIRRTALERGIIDAARAEAMDRREVLLLSCLPGLSTAEGVSDVSGRGVGMDVVKSKVEAFGGSVQIDSSYGKGTKITLRLPLTLAIVQVLLVEIAGETYGIPVSHITHTTRVESSGIEWSRNRAVTRWGRNVVPLSDLGDWLGLSGRSLRREGPVSVVLAEQDGGYTGLAVDRLIGANEVVIKPLGLPLKNIPGLAGATIMGDGRTVLVLDVKALLAQREVEDGAR